MRIDKIKMAKWQTHMRQRLLQVQSKNHAWWKKKNRTMGRKGRSKTTRFSKMAIENRCLLELDKYLYKGKLRHQVHLRIASWSQIWRSVQSPATLATMTVSCSMQPWWEPMKTNLEVSSLVTPSREMAKSTIKCRPLTTRVHLKYRDDSQNLKPCEKLLLADLAVCIYLNCQREVSLGSQKMWNSCLRGASIWSNSWKRS